MWSLDHLSVSVPSRGLYKTKPSSPRVIKSFIQVPRQGQETRTKNKKMVVVGSTSIGVPKVSSTSSGYLYPNVGIKRLLDDLEVTADKLMLLVYKLLLLVFRLNAAGTKLQLLKD
ncbi:hypothetical protein Tco_0266154 [Tanacetum coccineum]